MGTSQIGIRGVRKEDAANLANMQAQAWRSAFEGLIPSPALNALDSPERTLRWEQIVADPAHTIHVATLEEQLCGLIVLLPSRDADASSSVGEIGALVVAPSAWRRGVGRTLMDSALEASTASGYGDVTLWVFEENARARHFYEAQRFTADGATQMKQRNGYRLQEVRYRRVSDVR